MPVITTALSFAIKYPQNEEAVSAKSVAAKQVPYLVYVVNAQTIRTSLYKPLVYSISRESGYVSYQNCFTCTWERHAYMRVREDGRKVSLN